MKNYSCALHLEKSETFQLRPPSFDIQGDGVYHSHQSHSKEIAKTSAHIETTVPFPFSLGMRDRTKFGKNKL